jgi:Caulimovirus viroplasmin
MPKSKFYAVARGREIGIFSTWPECQKQVLMTTRNSSWPRHLFFFRFGTLLRINTEKIGILIAFFFLLLHTYAAATMK